MAAWSVILRSSKEHGTPNLDTWDPQDLREFAAWIREHNSDGSEAHRLLFPRRRSIPSFVWIRLETYADLKAIAIRYRLDGNIDKAMRYEAAADAEYLDLPMWARW